MSVLDYHRRLRLINTIVEDSKLRYYEHASVTCPCTDGHTIKMPPFNPMFTAAEERRWMFSLLHECYHVIGDNKDDFTIVKTKDINMNSEFGMVLNIVVDHNIEHKRQGIYEGADKWIEETYSYYKAERQGSECYQQMPDAIAAVVAFDTIIRSTWLLPTDYNIRDDLSVAAQARLDKLLADDDLIAEYLRHKNGGQENYDLALRMFDVQGDDSSEKEQEAQQQSNGGEEGEGTGSEQAAGTGQSTEAEKGEGEGKAGAHDDITVQYEVSPHSGEALSADTMGGNVHIVYDEKDFEAHTDYEPATVNEKVPDSSNRDPHQREGDVRSKMSSTLSTKVRNVLKVHSQARYQGGKSRGKINKRALARISTGYDRVWRSKEIRDVLDTCVTVLVDSSGSMSGSKYSHATAAALMMNECLSKLAVPHEIIGFSYGWDDNDAYMHKRMSEVVDPDELMGRMLSSEVRMNCNSDGDSINHAHDRLIRNKQKRKILIVLSDGSPAGQAGSQEYTVRVVKEIEQKSPVEIYGIGIEDTNVSRIYKNFKVINDASELEDALLNTIKSFMVK